MQGWMEPMFAWSCCLETHTIPTELVAEAATVRAASKQLMTCAAVTKNDQGPHQPSQKTSPGDADLSNDGYTRNCGQS